MTGLDRARAEHDAEKDTDYWSGYPVNEPTKPATTQTDICTFCEHPTDQHGEHRCAIPVSPGSPILCKCPRNGPRK